MLVPVLFVVQMHTLYCTGSTYSLCMYRIVHTDVYMYQLSQRTSTPAARAAVVSPARARERCCCWLTLLLLLVLAVLAGAVR